MAAGRTGGNGREAKWQTEKMHHPARVTGGGGGGGGGHLYSALYLHLLQQGNLPPVCLLASGPFRAIPSAGVQLTFFGAQPPLPANIRWSSRERVPRPPRRSMARGLPHRRIFAGQAGSASPASQDAPWRAYRRIFAGQAGSASPARQDTPWRAVYAPFAH